MTSRAGARAPTRGLVRGFPSLSLAAFALVSFSAGLFGCRAWPTRPVVEEIELEAAGDFDEDELFDSLATRETSLFLGLIPRVLEYETYEPAVLAKDLRRIERWLRARGYYEAKVTAARVIKTSEHHVRVEISVDAGALVLVRRVDPAGIALLPPEVAGSAVAAIGMRPGDTFDEGAFDADKQALLRVLNDGGYAFARVKAHAEVDIARRAADVSYSVELGRRSVVGPIRVLGLGEIPEDRVRDTIYVEEGDPYSRADIEDAQKALVNLGVFATVEIEEDRSRPEAGVVPLSVRVRESKLRTVRVGGGARFDVLRLSAHLRAGWEDRNFLGGMRRLGLEAQPGLTFFPTRCCSFPLDTPQRILPEFRLRVEFRQPSFLEKRTAGFVNAEYNVYPVLYPFPDDFDPTTERIIGYNQIKTEGGLERALFGQHLTLIPAYNWQASYPFSYRGALQDGLEPIRVSYPELTAVLDFRDDPVRTTRGLYLSNSVQVAGYIFQGTVSDVRVRPEVRVYTRGALGRNSVFAARASVGFLFPGNYGETLDPNSAAGQAAEGDPTNPAVVSDQQKLLFRAFYSGGPNSNRGYPFRAVGPHGPIGFLVPTNLSGVNCNLEDVDLENLPSGCVRPLGGLSLWELSLETRFPISDSFAGVLFVDASDLTTDRGALRVNVPHIAPGIGLRYATPVGPFRLDLGFRPPYLQHLGQKELAPEDGNPGNGLFGVPASLYLAIGEAF